MIAAISFMRRLAGVEPDRFRRHWLEIHGPLVQSFAGLRRYEQCHVQAANEPAAALGIDGFPILFFDNDSDRKLAHGSKAMADCNIDSRSFIGAVTRVISTPVPLKDGSGPACAMILSRPDDDPDRLQAALLALPKLAGLTRYNPLEQGPAPASTVPHLPVAVSAVFQAWFASPEDRAAALATCPAPSFAVEEIWLPPTSTAG